MRRFEVYKHPTLGLAAVKHGFSWPALFFPFIWMLIKLMWQRAALWFAVGFILVLVEDLSEGSESLPGKLLFVVSTLADIALWLAPAIWGNRWLAEDLIARGYGLVVTLEADSVSDAVAQIAQQGAPGDRTKTRAA